MHFCLVWVFDIYCVMVVKKVSYICTYGYMILVSMVLIVWMILVLDPHSLGLEKVSVGTDI